MLRAAYPPSSCVRRYALALLPLATACTDAPVAESVDAGPKRPSMLTIFSTGDVGSDTDVCGCMNRPMGGVARRAAQLKLLRSEAEGPTLIVDAGDLFFRNWSISPLREAQARETAALHADLARRFDVAAIAVGERDLALGLSVLRQLGRRAETKLLSANLRHVDSGTAAFDAFALVERDGLRIGLVGASPELPEQDPASAVYRRAGLTVEPAAKHVRAAALAAKAAGADLVIGLFHLTQFRALALVRELPPGLLTYGVVAHDRMALPLRLAPGAAAAFTHPGDRGKYLAAATIEFAGPDATGVVDLTTFQKQERRIAKLDEQLRSLGAASDGGLSPRARRLVERRRVLVEDRRRVDFTKRHKVDAQLLALDIDLPEDPEVLGLYRAYQRRLEEVNAAARTSRNLTYIGTRKCASCHAPAFKHWKRTRHAQAWNTMKANRQTANLDCIPCHVTGFERPGGPRTLRDLPGFVNVGCESCHGPGSVHAKTPEEPLDYARTVPERVCAECHRVAEDQKPFVYADRLPRVLGPGHGASTNR